MVAVGRRVANPAEGDPMRDSREASRRTDGWSRRQLAGAAVCVLLVAVAACSGDDDASSGSSGANETDQDLSKVLGPEDHASGEPVKIGMVSDGATAAYDNRDELRAGKATADFWNEHRGGIGGRPIEVVTCETGGDPAGATDCGNRMVEKGVVAVTVAQSAVTDSLWEPLHDAGIPAFF